MRGELEAVALERQRLMSAVEQKVADVQRETESRLALEKELSEQRRLEAEVRQQLQAAAEEKERLFKMVGRRLLDCKPLGSFSLFLLGFITRIQLQCFTHTHTHAHTYTHIL
jgi:hypothetical protein